MKNLNLDKFLKISVIIAILLISLSVAYYYFVFLPNKEKEKLEMQRQEQTRKELQQQAEQEYQREQKKKEYIAKRKKECYDIYLQEKKLWSNVEDFSYSEVRDVCIVVYKSSKPPKSKEECDKIIENLSKIKDESLEDMIFRRYFDCLENTFSKEF
jgi:hypothetical protein